MKLGIVCSANHSLGHASVARSLARTAREQLNLERLVIFSDQIATLNKHKFFDDWIELIPLQCARLPMLDLLLLDTIPFRRADALFTLLQGLQGRKQQFVVGHTGWVPFASPRHLQEWRDLFSFLGNPNIILYHDKSVCNGVCHMERLVAKLQLSLIHAGLLLPIHRPKNLSPRPRTFAALCGGGFQTDAFVDQVTSLQRRLRDWQCDLFIGPYAELQHVPEHTRVVAGVCDIASRLEAYSFSVTRAGYSSCCEHIAAQVPTILAPLKNFEQHGNATWSNPFLKIATVSNAGKLLVRDPLGVVPTSFSWQLVLNSIK